MEKSKTKQRQEAIERLRKYLSYTGDYRDAAHAMIGDEYFELTGEECIERIIGLLTDDEPDERYIELPVDSDGEVIHIGDKMERLAKRGRVVALMLSNYPQKWGGGLHWGVQLEGEQAPTALDSLLHHCHKPTVEDVLREFGDEVRRCCDTEDTIAEYAKKLQMREEQDEA